MNGGVVGDPDRGVSTVIGVVVMVSIVVLLASVVAIYLVSFAEGGGREPAPTVGASVDYNRQTTGNGHYLNVTYKSGEPLETGDFEIRVTDAESVDPGGAIEKAVYTGSVLSTAVGSTFRVSESFSLDRTDFEEADGDPITGSEYLDLSEATVTIYWRSGDRSAPVFEWQG